MTVGSKVNPNYPIPGIDQSSRGFRDNFATIKTEIENLQSKNIQLVGSLLSEPVQIGNGVGDIIIPVEVSLTNIQAAGSNLSVQYNFNNLISGSQIYYNNGSVGIGTNVPKQTLDVIGSIRVVSPFSNTYMRLGSNLTINASFATTTFSTNHANALVILNSTRAVGIGSAPQSTFDIWSNTNDMTIIHALLDNQDNTARITTGGLNNTLGLAFEQTNTNRVGGMRMDQNGNISLHAGEDAFANLSNTSRVINILPNHNVGIGSTDPQNTLDVAGNASVSGTLTAGNIVIASAFTFAGNLAINTSVPTNATASIAISSQHKTMLQLASLGTTANIWVANTDSSTTTVFQAPYSSYSQQSITTGGLIESVHQFSTYENIQPSLTIANDPNNGNLTAVVINGGTWFADDVLTVNGNVQINGNLMVGTVPTIVGSKVSGAALASLLTAMAAMGLIIDNTTL